VNLKELDDSSDTGYQLSRHLIPSKSVPGTSLRDLTQLFVSCGFFISFIVAAYLQRGRFDQLFLFDAPDTPPVPGAFYPGPLGVHTFGDFLQPLWQSRLTPSPFITGYSSYMPAANGLFWILSWLPFWIAFGTLVAFSIATLLFPFWMVDSEADYWVRGQLLVGGVILAYPVLSALDRGNIQFLTIGLIALAMYLRREQRWAYAGICLGIAIGLKVYPFLFLFLFLKRKSWKSTAFALGTAASVTAIPLLLFDGGLGKNVRALLSNLGSSQTELSSLALFSNNSLTALGLSSVSVGLSTFGNFLNNNMSLIVSMLCLLLLVSCFARDIEDLEIALLVSSVCTLAISFSAGYVLMIFLVPAWIVYDGRSQLSDKRILFYSLCIAFLMMPKQIPLRFWADSYRQDSASLASFLNPLVMLILVTAISGRAAYTSWKTWCARGALNPHIPSNIGS